MSTPNLHQSSTLADLARLVEGVNRKAPELYARAVPGASLLLTGAISPDPESGPSAYRVRGSQAEPYTVDLAGDCPYEDYRRRGVSYRGRKFCKHQLAALFYRRLSELVSERRPSRRFALLRTYRPRRTARPARATEAA